MKLQPVMSAEPGNISRNITPHKILIDYSITQHGGERVLNAM